MGRHLPPLLRDLSLVAWVELLNNLDLAPPPPSRIDQVSPLFVYSFRMEKRLYLKVSHFMVSIFLSLQIALELFRAPLQGLGLLPHLEVLLPLVLQLPSGVLLPSDLLQYLEALNGILEQLLLLQQVGELSVNHLADILHSFKSTIFLSIFFL